MLDKRKVKAHVQKGKANRTMVLSRQLQTLAVLLAVSLLSLAPPLHARQQQKQMMKIGDELVSVEAGQAFVRAQDLMSKKQYDQAAAVLTSALALEPNCAPIRYKYGFVLLQQGKNAEVLEQAKKCVGIAPNFSNGWALLGEASMNLNLKKEATEAYEKALALQPKGENADIIREHLKDIQGESEDPPMEISAPDPKITEQNRINMKVNRALALCSSATQHASQKQFDQGLQECRDALTIAPDSDRIKENFVVYLNNYAADCVQNQKVKQAESLMTEAINFQNKGGVTTKSQLTTLKNYSALLNFLGRSDESKKIEAQMKTLAD